MRERAEAILKEIDYSHSHVHWGEHRQEALSLAWSLAGYKPKGNCLACHLKVVNILRGAIDLPPIGLEATQSQHERRLSICRGVSNDGSDACEHLAWPGLNCGVCGCFVDIKARFKKQHCPLGKW